MTTLVSCIKIQTMKYSGSDDIGFVWCLIRFYNLPTSGDGFPCAMNCTERLLLSGAVMFGSFAHTDEVGVKILSTLAQQKSVCSND
jgi:hypothetical protein